MVKYLVSIIVFLLLANFAQAQKLNVHVKDSFGNPIHALTVFIPEIKQGLISNAEGKLQIQLNEGNYTLVCILPGYERLSGNISISKNEELYKEIIIDRDSLNTYDNRQKKHTLAHDIIKKSSGKSADYNNAVQSYNAKFYLNGKLTIGNVHSFWDRLAYKLNQIHLSELKDKIFTREMLNEIEYSSPDHYNIKVHASRGNIPDIFTNKAAMDPLKGSIYSNKFGKFISPLTHNSHHYYKFKYEGYYKSGDVITHKIRVNSKIDSSEFFNGYLYIEDGSWTVNYAIIESEVQGLRGTVSISYCEIEEGVYLPITYYNDILFDYLGAEGKIKYYTALQYGKIYNEKVLQNKIELKDSVIKTDSSFHKKEKVYWENIRLQPLTKDSVNQLPDTFYIRKDKISISKYWIGKVIVGDYILGNDSSNLSLKYNGIKMIFRDYNYVDGFWLGNKFDFKMTLKNNTSIEAYPYIYYITGRNRILAGSEISYNYKPKRVGELIFNIHSRTEDFNSLSVTRYQNYFASLFFGENYNFFYQRDQASLANSIHLNSKIKLTTSFGIEKRHGLTNHTDFNLFNRNHIKQNMFPNDRFDRTYYSVGISYSPNSNYSITEALDMYERRVTPVFNIEYQEGFSSWQTNNSTYRKLKGGLSHNIRLGYFSAIDYKIESGIFLSRGRKMHFTDYQHFGSSDLILNLNSLFDSFLLLDNYELQTNKQWFNLFLNFSDRYLLLKRIRFLQNKPFTESLHFKTLITPDVDSYIETGYSISLNRYFGIGTFLSFHNTKVKKIGIVFSLNLRSLKFE